MRGLKRLPSTIDARTLKSHLLQMRGLKPPIDYYLAGTTCRRIFYRCVDWNLQFEVFTPHAAESHLLQMRGLKLLEWKMLSNNNVASFTDAWIETSSGVLTDQRGLCRIFYRCVDWNQQYDGPCKYHSALSHLLQMRGLKPAAGTA